MLLRKARMLLLQEAATSVTPAQTGYTEPDLVMPPTDIPVKTCPNCQNGVLVKHLGSSWVVVCSFPAKPECRRHLAISVNGREWRVLGR